MCGFFPFIFRTALLCCFTLIMFWKLCNHCACLFSRYLPTPHTVRPITANTTPTWKKKGGRTSFDNLIAFSWSRTLLLFFCGFTERTTKMIRQVSSCATLEAAWKIPPVSLSQKLLSKPTSALISSPPPSSAGCCSHRVCFWVEVAGGCSVSYQLPIHRLARRENLEATTVRNDIKIEGKGTGNWIDYVEFQGRFI